MGVIDLDKLVECEFSRFSANDYRGLPDAPEFEFVEGDLPVLISAPHAVTHMRDGRVKPSEDFTGAIALAVAQAGRCHALVATRTGAGDPNWDPFERSAYKQALCSYVREKGVAFVVDLHGMVAASDELVAVGSADGLTVAAANASADFELVNGLGVPDASTAPTDANMSVEAPMNAETTSAPCGFDERVTSLLRRHLAPWCERYGKPVVLNGRYGARSRNTIAQTVARECGVSALQVEVATQLRVPKRFSARIPRNEPIPFTNKQLPVELVARRNADPAAVTALIDALLVIIGDSLLI